jgi:nitrogen fixation protein NifX
MSEGLADGLSREVALRIAVAARAIPGLALPTFVNLLAGLRGLPLSTAKLSGITVDDLQRMLARDPGVDAVERAALKQALRHLRGEDIGESDLPPICPYAEGDMPGSIRVAVASNGAEALDGHFGSCLRFLVYQLSRTEIRLIAVRATHAAEAAEDPNAARAKLIGDCQLVWVQSIGGPAAAKVVRAGIHPLQERRGGSAREVLARLQAALTAPPPWLARIMGVPPRPRSRHSENLDV